MTTKPTPDVPIDAPTAERIAHAIATLGEAGVVERATALLAGLNAGDEFLLSVGGRHAQGILDGAPPLYWPELWGARAFLYAWNDTAAQAVRAGLGNQAWRVREMCARVVAERSLELAETLRPLLTDDVARVRAAAARALGAVGEASDKELLANLFRDPEIDVRRGAEQATKQLTTRFAAPQ